MSFAVRPLRTVALKRRLYSKATAHVLPVLRSFIPISIKLDKEAVACRSCIRDIEKVHRLRRELDELESKIAAAVRRSTADTHHALNPSRQKRSRELLARPEDEDSPAKRARQSLSQATPTRLFMQTTHVQTSPAVAVSLIYSQ